MRIRLEKNEMILMAIFSAESRQAIMDRIQNVLPYVREDEEMQALVVNTLKKMQEMTEQEFQSVDLEVYRLESAEEE